VFFQTTPPWATACVSLGTYTAEQLTVHIYSLKISRSDHRRKVKTTAMYTRREINDNHFDRANGILQVVEVYSSN